MVMRPNTTAPLLTAILASACAGDPAVRTLAELHHVEPDVGELALDDGLEQAIAGYQSFLSETPESPLTPEAMRRLADLKLEKEFGLQSDGGDTALPKPTEGHSSRAASSERIPPPSEAAAESDRAFEERTTTAYRGEFADAAAELALPGGAELDPTGPEEAIALYDEILVSYPGYVHNDQVLYQKARAYDELGRVDEAVTVIESLVAQYPASRFIDEVQFRRAEYFFTRKKFYDAERSYAAVTDLGPDSEYYELALYKLGWSYYKQDFHEEALHQFVTLLDYKVSVGHDFDRTSDDEDEERRIADTYRVISLSFSHLGGPQSVEAYFTSRGTRSYEHHIYSHLGDFYLDKLRYHDAAAAYDTFVSLHPHHRAAPHFGMRVVQIYEAGGFPKLVLESKKTFAEAYALQSEYWRRFDVGESPEVVDYLKSNLEDLAHHYHALYQDAAFEEERPGNFEEAQRWYRAYLESFPSGAGTPALNYRFADLLLEHGSHREAAREYERTAYDYEGHDQAAAAGYSAIYAHREERERVLDAEQDEASRRAVASTLRFVDAFLSHEHAATVLGAAVHDLYQLGEHEIAVSTGQELLAKFPNADPKTRRLAWTAIGHASFDLGRYAEAEDAYTRLLSMTPIDADLRQALTDNLAASIYKQGEQASETSDHAAAAAHFLRVKEAAPTSEIRSAAEYDAGAAFIHLEDWSAAARVLKSFRDDHPEHELREEATRQLALVYEKEGSPARAAEEYRRVADGAETPELRREALLVAGQLYEDAADTDRALETYLHYVAVFPKPIEDAVGARQKLAELYAARRDGGARREQLQQIVASDAAAGSERTPRTRHLAARAALALAEERYRIFEGIELRQPFEENLEKKQRQMDVALDAFGELVDYEVADVTAAATYYIARVYFDFSAALVGSERPAGLDSAAAQDYESAIEAEAFPFEERAIDVYQKNLELMAKGVYNSWIEKSLAELARLVPGRFAKFETSSGFISSIDHDGYRHVVAPQPRTAVAETAPREPNAAVRDEEAERAPASGERMVGDPKAETSGGAPSASAAIGEGETQSPAESDTTMEPRVGSDTARETTAETAVPPEPAPLPASLDSGADPALGSESTPMVPANVGGPDENLR